MIARRNNRSNKNKRKFDFMPLENYNRTMMLSDNLAF